MDAGLTCQNRVPHRGQVARRRSRRSAGVMARLFCRRPTRRGWKPNRGCSGNSGTIREIRGHFWIFGDNFGDSGTVLEIPGHFGIFGDISGENGTVWVNGDGRARPQRAVPAAPATKRSFSASGLTVRALESLVPRAPDAHPPPCDRPAPKPAWWRGSA